MPDGVEVRYEGDIAILEMKCGKNEFTFNFINQLNEALDEILRNPNASGVITTGQGKFYSNGIDLIGLGAMSNVITQINFMECLCKLINRILTFPLPTIAAINGHAFAGGCFMALAHDHRVMNSDRGWICMPEIRMPSKIPLFLLELARTKLPQGRAQTDIIVMGRRCPAAHAHKIGVADVTAPADSLLPAAIQLMQELLALGSYERDSMKDMKNDVYRHVTNKLDVFGSIAENMIKPRL